MKQFIKSIKEKASTISENGIVGVKAIKEGFDNYNNPTKETELLAKERLKECLKCEFYEEEESDLLKIEDTLMIELDSMKCGHCSCALTYKLRQSILKCNKWNC